MLKDKLDNMDGESKLQKRLIERASQPHSYIMQDVERAERELVASTKRVKSLEEELKKARKDIDNLAIVSETLIQYMYVYSKNEDCQRTSRSYFQNVRTSRICRQHCKD